ncbi:MAG TPA: hypothetical protein VJ249_07620 [Candidatus Bathyarchaeia archaeon]|nr:hypothetical protein [Candidatus Bathyarchaeia archaeon]
MSLELLKKPVNCGRVFVLILLFSMIAASNIQTAKADPITINVSPASAPVGTIVTVTGVNATAGAEVRIYLIGFLLLKTTTANETGGYSVNITVPAVPFGMYLIMALDVAEGDTASTTFTAEPIITLNPTMGGYNTQVFIRGDGFQGFSDITILFDGTDVTPSPTPQTDPIGSFETSFFVISAPNGTYTVTASDMWGNSASTEFNVVPRIMCVWPGASGSPSTLVVLDGFGFGSSVNITLRFGSVDFTPYPWMLTNFDGSFELPFFVPDVPDGIYTIEANDTDGNMAFLQFMVPSPILTLTPNRTSEASLVVARGIGFMPNARILLYLEDVAMTHLIDLMWMSPNLIVMDDGSFEYSFIVPVTEPGVYTVTAFMMLGAPTDLKELASAPLTINDNSPIDMEVNVGAIHFRGEIAEFYVKTAFGGNLVNGKIDVAKLYYSSGAASLDLTSSVQGIATGLFRIPYSIPGNASQGTYTLVVEAHYYADGVEAYGAASGSFLISPTLTSANAQLIDVNDQIGTIVIPDLGVIKVNLTSINARLVSVQGTEATIQSDIGTLKTTADAINAEVTSIDGDVATISSDLGTVKSHVTTTGFQLETATLIVALVAAAGSMLSFLFIRKMKPPVPTPPSSPAQPPADPAEPKSLTQQTTAVETAALTETLTPTESTTPAEPAGAVEQPATSEQSLKPSVFDNVRDE